MKTLLTTTFAATMFLCALALRAGDTAAPATTPTPSYHASILKLFGNDVIAVDKAQIATAPEIIKAKKYLFIFKGAQWCVICRGFSSRLVTFYQKYYADKGDFDVVFVSSDHNQTAMDRYMKSRKMPWIGLKLDSEGAEALKKKYPAETLPSLVLLDENDKVIAGTHTSKGKPKGGINIALDTYLKLHGEPPMPKEPPILGPELLNNMPKKAKSKSK